MNSEQTDDPLSIEIASVVRAVDTNGNEWVPLEQYRKVQAQWEALRCMVVNPRRNVLRALKALTAAEKDEKRARYFLDHALEELESAYETAFPPMPSTPYV